MSDRCDKYDLGRFPRSAKMPTGWIWQETGGRLTMEGTCDSFRLRQAWLSGLLMLVFSAVAAAQITSTIQGNIADPNGASVPEAKVTATNEETGVSRSATSATD